MNASRASAKAIGPSATSMNGRRRPSGVWNVSLHGPITSGSVSANAPSAASTSPTSVVESVYRSRIGGRYAAVVVSAQARPSAPDPSASTFQRVAPGQAVTGVRASPPQTRSTMVRSARATSSSPSGRRPMTHPVRISSRPP